MSRSGLTAPVTQSEPLLGQDPSVLSQGSETLGWKKQSPWDSVLCRSSAVSVRPDGRVAIHDEVTHFEQGQDFRLSWQRGSTIGYLLEVADRLQ